MIFKLLSQPQIKLNFQGNLLKTLNNNHFNYSRTASCYFDVFSDLDNDESLRSHLNKLNEFNSYAVDFGCGAGIAFSFLKTKHPNITFEGISYKKVLDYNTKINIYEGDAHKIILPRTVDIAVDYFGVISYSPNPIFSLVHILSQLTEATPEKTGGRLYLKFDLDFTLYDSRGNTKMFFAAVFRAASIENSGFKIIAPSLNKNIIFERQTSVILERTNGPILIDASLIELISKGIRTCKF